MPTFPEAHLPPPALTFELTRRPSSALLPRRRFLTIPLAHPSASLSRICLPLPLHRCSPRRAPPLHLCPRNLPGLCSLSLTHPMFLRTRVLISISRRFLRAVNSSSRSTKL